MNKARLLEKIAELVRDKEVEGITALRDESDKDGMRMVIEVRRGDQPEIVLNNLFKHTQLQVVFGINMVALDNGQPRVLNLKQLLHAFLQHRREVVTRRTLFELRKARERAHLLEGLAVALANIDTVIALIKASQSPNEAKVALLERAWESGTVTTLLAVAGAHETRPEHLSVEYGLRDSKYYLSPAQAQAILDLRLHRLTGLEQDKIHNEYQEIIQSIQALIKIVSDPDELHRVIRHELIEVKDQFGDKRRTVILAAHEDLSNEDLITEQDLVVTLSKEGYIKSQSLDSYAAQHRGGRGKTATTMKERDFIKNILVAHSHNYILCFSTLGKVYWLKAYEVPEGSRNSQGRPVVNLLPLEKEEQISTILPVKEFSEGHFVFMATQRGVVKKVPLVDFAKPRSNGKVALELNEGDSLIGAGITNGNNEVMLISDAGKAIRFPETTVRPMGRTARGVHGMRLVADHNVMTLLIVDDRCTLLTATVEGYGQRTSLADYRAIGRGGQGVRAIQVNERNGKVVAATQVLEDDELLLISDQGTLVRIRVSEISVLNRNTQGVRLIHLGSGENLVGIESIRGVETATESVETVHENSIPEN